MECCLVSVDVHSMDDGRMIMCLLLAIEFLTIVVLVDAVTVYGLIVQVRHVNRIKLIKLLINGAIS